MRQAVPTEHAEQVALFDWWRLWARNHPALLWAIPNGGRRDAVTGARLKAEGVMAGIPDICLSWPSQGHHGLFIELKRQRIGKVSNAQQAACEALKTAGYRVEVCRGWQEAKTVIENYLGEQK